MNPQHLAILTEAIPLVFSSERHADKLLEQIFKPAALKGSDKKAIADNFYEIIRWWRLLVAVNGNNDAMDADNIARIIGINLVRKSQSFPKGKVFDKMNYEKIRLQLRDAELEPAVRHSLPDWLEETGSAQLGESWEPLINVLNSSAPLSIRVNTLKMDADTLLEFFQNMKVNIKYSPHVHEGLIIDDNINLFQLDAHRNGWFELQDESSMAVSLFMDIKPGMRVIDACAGAGGKSLHIAALLENRGKVMALDIHQRKLDELKRRAKRADAQNIETKLIDTTKTTKRLNGTGDRVLIDVPCSGLGVLRRNPDIKWRLQPAEIENLLLVQKKILQDYSHMTKKGGLLCYVSCSILRTENEDQVAGFLSRNPNFKLVEEKRVGPVLHGGDGFYMAKMERIS